MKDLINVITRIKRYVPFNKGDICLIGCSTSEVIKEKIGTVGLDGSCRNYFNALDVVE